MNIYIYISERTTKKKIEVEGVNQVKFAGYITLAFLA